MGACCVDKCHFNELYGAHDYLVGLPVHRTEEVVYHVEELVVNEDIDLASLPEAKLTERVELSCEHIEITLAQVLPEVHEPLGQGASAGRVFDSSSIFGGESQGSQLGLYEPWRHN